MVEQLICNQKVLGSIPSAGTSENNGLEIKTPGCFYLQGIGGVLRKRR
ncbi:hypothetical protein CARN8_160003 [mine drainage metagenome]|uniref:Uncharacterized protein n=1 Tax=mine drainage metagenome TaxID=410659 RepID=A0A3P3ZM00_9ZZZZ